MAKIAFWTCLVVAIGLFVGGFFAPPTGEIHGSVLSAGGMLFGFGALGMLPTIIETASHARISKGDVSIEVTKNEK